MPPFSTLRVDLGDDGVGRLALARPERRNPLGSDALREIVDAMAWFDDRDARVVVVHGEGRAFSGGFDRDEMAGPDLDPAALMELGARMADVVEDSRAVTIAAVHGHCVGGGVVLAAACDLRLAAHDARFRIPEVDLGIPLGWGGIPRLVREIGPARARELVLTCREFDAAEATAMGFVNAAVPVDELLDHARRLAHDIASRPPAAVRATTEQVRRAARALVPPDTGTDDVLGAIAAAREDTGAPGR